MEHKERIAVLETEMKGLQNTLHNEVMPILRDVQLKLNKQAGFMAGAAAVMTFIWGLIVAAGIAVYEYFTK